VLMSAVLGLYKQRFLATFPCLRFILIVNSTREDVYALTARPVMRRHKMSSSPFMRRHKRWKGREIIKEVADGYEGRARPGRLH